jgi:hypothetical protein
MTITLQLLNEKIFQCEICNEKAENYIISFLGQSFYSCEGCYDKILTERIPRLEYDLLNFSKILVNTKEEDETVFPYVCVSSSAFLVYSKDLNYWKVPVNIGSCLALKYLTFNEMRQKLDFVPLLQIDVKAFQRILEKNETDRLLYLNKNLLHECILSNWKIRNIFHGILYDEGCHFVKYKIPMEIFYYIYNYFF